MIYSLAFMENFEIIKHLIFYIKNLDTQTIYLIVINETIIQTNLDFFIKSLYLLFLLSSNNCFIIMPLPPHLLF